MVSPSGCRVQQLRRDDDAPGRNRTCDLALRRRTLYPLSYRRVGLSLPPVKLTHRTVTLALREPFSISRSTDETVDSVFVEVEHEGVTGYGEASPQEHYGESAASASTFLSAAESLLGDDPFALDEIEERLAALRASRRRRRRSTWRSTTCAASSPGVPVWRLLGLRRDGPADLLDDLARRPRRHGAADRACGRPLPAAEAEARRRATGSTSSGCARCAASPSSRSRWT